MYKRSENFSLKAGRQFISFAARTERAPWIYSPLFCSAWNLVKKKNGSRPHPWPLWRWVNTLHWGFLIPGVIPSFHTRWRVRRPLVSKSLIWLKQKRKNFYKIIREMGRGLASDCKWKVHLWSVTLDPFYSLGWWVQKCPLCVPTGNMWLKNN